MFAVMIKMDREQSILEVVNVLAIYLLADHQAWYLQTERDSDLLLNFEGVVSSL